MSISLCLFVVYVLSMCRLCVVYVLSMCCLCVVYLLSMSCLCLVYVLSMSCLCFVYVLSMSCPSNTLNYFNHPPPLLPYHITILMFCVPTSQCVTPLPPLPYHLTTYYVRRRYLQEFSQLRIRWDMKEKRNF